MSPLPSWRRLAELGEEGGEGGGEGGGDDGGEGGSDHGGEGGSDHGGDAGGDGGSDGGSDGGGGIDSSGCATFPANAALSYSTHASSSLRHAQRSWRAPSEAQHASQQCVACQVTMWPQPLGLSVAAAARRGTVRWAGVSGMAVRVGGCREKPGGLRVGQSVRARQGLGHTSAGTCQASPRTACPPPP